MGSVNQVLFLHASDEYARERFEREHRGYWSSALTVVLEKHGYLALDVADHGDVVEALAGPHDILLVAALPEHAWTTDAVEALRTTRKAVLLEGPLPAPVATLVGVTEQHPLPPEGTIKAVDERIVATSAALGGTPSAELAGPRTRAVHHDPALDWTALGVPITDAQAEAWRALGWDAAEWSVGPEAKVIAEWVSPSGTRSPAIVSRDSIYATSFGMFASLAQSHTSQPYRPAEFLSSPRSFGLELLLLAILEELHRVVRRWRVRLLPWPEPAGWALTVRHDFDRHRTPEQVIDVLERHRRAGTSATWYWRASHLTAARFVGLGGRRAREANDAVRLVATAPRQEVALHTERLWADGGAERKKLERIAGVTVRGTSSHGDERCFRFQGAPNILWAETEGLDYTELIQQAHYHPHRFVALGPDGVVAPLRVICLPHHLSFDHSVRTRKTGAEDIKAALPTWQAVGGLMQVMNHPDINVDPLFTMLGEFAHQGRIDFTAEAASDWWRRTHTRDELCIDIDSDGDVQAQSSRGVRGAIVEIADPSGAVSRRQLDLEASEPDESSRY